MANFKITLAYDGTDFVGWQRQAEGTSVQGLVEDALRDLDGRHVVVHGAGRTDAGAHALGQVASFTLVREMTADTLVRAINARLPDTIRVLHAASVDPGFHARFSARAKMYRYRLWNADVANPFERAYAWHVMGDLDVEAMRAAAQTLAGVHDFAAFQAGGASTATTAREIFRSHIGRDAHGDRASLITYEILGDGFLRHMVRTIVGSLVEIGRGRHDPSWLAGVTAQRDRALAGPTAPAAGLFLVRVLYGAGALADEP